MEKKKKAFSYSTYEDVRETAMQKAEKEGTTVSKLLHEFLVGYAGSTEPASMEPGSSGPGRKATDSQSPKTKADKKTPASKASGTKLK
jgi:hypothetical protein